MAIAAAQLSILSMTAQKADLEYDLTTISQQRQTLAIKQSAIYAKEYGFINNYSKIQTVTLGDPSLPTDVDTQEELTAYINKQVKSLSENGQSYEAQMASFENNLKQLQLKDNQFDLSQKKTETKLLAINTNLEAQGKLIDSNIKKDFAPNLSL